MDCLMRLLAARHPAAQFVDDIQPLAQLLAFKDTPTLVLAQYFLGELRKREAGLLFMSLCLSDADGTQHHVLLVFDRAARRVSWVDSIKDSLPDATPAALSRIRAAVATLPDGWDGPEVGWAPWPAVPEQTNLSDCGVYVIEFADMVAGGTAPPKRVPSSYGGNLRRKWTVLLAESLC